MARKKSRIVVVGSANVDLTTFTDRFPKAGETLFGTSFDLGFGGKGANQAVAASYCGADAHMVARVGDDLFGPASIRNFKKLGIGAKHVTTAKGTSSGVAPIFVEANGQNRILVVKGANDTVTPKTVRRARKLFDKAALVVMQFEIPIDTVEYTIRYARKKGVPVILNPAPAVPVELDRIKDVDYFIPNESEAEALTGKKVKTLDDAKTCAEHLMSVGFRRVILTLGERGAMLASGGTVERIAPFEVDAVDTTGAGDAFIGSFASFLAEGFDERDAVERASLYAAMSTTGVGTQKSFPKRRRFEKEWKARQKAAKIKA